MNLPVVAADTRRQPRSTSPLRARIALGAALVPKLGAAALGAFLVFGVGAPWLLFDAPPSPFETFALKALCKDASRHPQAGCPTPAALSARAAPAPRSLRDPLK